MVYHPKIDIKIEGGKVTVSSKNVGKKEKMHLGSIAAHIKNVMKGANEGYVYKLKVCSGHFPMTVKVSDKEISVVNYIGEKVPRILKLKQGADVKLDGDIITVEAPDKELAGTVASDIELLMRLTNKDRRIYQDGIFIIEKAGRTL